MARQNTPDVIVVLCLAALGGLVAGCQTSPQAKEAKYLEHGKALLAKKDYSKAVLEFRNAAAAMPKDAEARYQLALAYLGEGDVANGAKALRQATELNPKHKEAQLKLAELMAASSSPSLIQEAASRLEGAFGSDPSDPDAMDTLAVAEWKLGRPDDAAQRLQEALKRFPTDLKASIDLAQMKMLAKDWDGAEGVLEKAVADSPKSAVAEVALAEFYNIRGRADRAEGELKKALQLDPQNGAALLALGAIQIAGKRMDEAEQTYRRASALPEKAYRPMHAIFLYRNGNRETALAEFRKLSQSDPNDRQARSFLVAAYVGMKRVGEAENALAEALKRNPKDTDALLQRAQLRLRSGKIEGAQNDLNSVLHFMPTSAAAHYFMAQAYRRQGLRSSEQGELQMALKASPTLLEARLALVGSYLFSGQGKAAAEVIEAAPDAQKTLPAWILGHNWALLAEGDLAQARPGIDQALKAGRPLEALYQDGALRLGQHDISGAQADMEEILQRDPSNVGAAEMLMDAYVKAGQTTKGLARLNQLAAARPDSIPLLQLLGKSYAGAGNLDSARQTFERLKALQPRYTPAVLALAELDIRQGMGDAALRKLRPVLDADEKNVPALLLAASAADSSGDQIAAVADYRKAVEVDPLNLVALNNLAYALSVNNPDEALKLAQKAAEIAPQSATVADTLGWIYYHKHMYSEAVQYLKTANASEPNPRRQFHLGMTFIRTGDQATGEKMVSDALQKDPSLANTERGW